jgi:glucose/arabinose dehydrogenase/mono/diheme cytochrome c family protein
MPRHSFFLSTSLVFMTAITPLSAQSPSTPTRTLFVNGDKFTLHPGGQERLPVLNNDYSKAGKIDSRTLVIETPPTHGQAIVMDGGIIEYTHSGAGFENDSFVYRVATQNGDSATAKVSISLSKQLRLTNATLNVPAAPPSTAYEWTDALPGLRFDEPCGLESIAGKSPRLFVLEKKLGIIRLVPDLKAPKLESLIFLDLNALLKSRGEKLATENEQGLTGIAFHPKQAENRLFFVFYSIKKSDGRSYERVSRFEERADNPMLADSASEVVFIEQLDQAPNHQGSSLRFGPDGYLYISLGDEGGQNDQYENGQNISKNFFSGILRIDVDRKPGGLEPNPHPAIPLTDGKARFTIPKDNPFVHQSIGGSWNGMLNGVTLTALDKVRTEFWAIGMRNPWQIHFDAKTGDLWMADVGGGSWEEVNIVTRGGNYGWPYREGLASGPKKPTAAETAFESVPSLHAYPHGSGTGQGNSITGGLVYHGSRFPELAGKYLFADYTSGNLWSLLRREGKPPVVTRLTGKSGITAFHADPTNGDVLATDYSGGKILRLVAGKPGVGFPQKLSDTRLFTRPSERSPASSVLPYAVNHPAWNDHALSRHWFVMPDLTSRIEGTRDGNWSFPAGMIWVQHLDLETERGNPQTARPIETRLLVKNEAGAYGVSYRWNDSGTEATLVPESGAEAQITVSEQGVSRSQTWRFPGQAECVMCHNPNAGFALSFNTRQLNRESILKGFPGNQLDLLSQHGLLAGISQPASAEPKHSASSDSSAPIAERSRSYLAVNCANCHQPGGLSPTPWNLRPEIALEQTGLINGLVINHGGNTARRIIAPGDSAHSQILTRMTASEGFLRMPLVGTRETDTRAVDLLKQWILSLPQ